jgi:hypothetical protein
MEKGCIYSSKPAAFDCSVLAIWFIPTFCIMIGALISRYRLPFLFWICVGSAALIVMLFIAWIPKSYEIFDDRLRIRCNLMKKEFHFKNIESIEQLPWGKLIWEALIDKSAYMTSFKNSIHIKLKGGLTKSTQVSPVDRDTFLKTLQECLEKYK